MTDRELQDVLERHKKWLDDEEGGEQADLYEADLYGAYLHGAYLRGADLYGADLRGADLRGADLRGAYLHGAYLRGADLHGADLRGAKIDDITAARQMSCPSVGAFTGWKMCEGYIIKLLIPKDAKRSSATGRKCRCSKAKVIAIENPDGSKAEITMIEHVAYGHTTVYEIGKMTKPDSFDDDRWNECSNGIHFFITRQEAVAYDCP